MHMVLERKSKIISLVAIILLSTGCQTLGLSSYHYSAAVLLDLSTRNESATAIKLEMCKDFQTASEAATRGEDTTTKLFGKAKALTDLSEALSKHYVQCLSAVVRIQDPQKRCLSNFNSSYWNNLSAHG